MRNGITLKSVISKVQLLLLDQLNMAVLEAGLLHINQSSDVKQASRDDAIVAILACRRVYTCHMTQLRCKCQMLTNEVSL